jgi:hypothetical protein
LIKVGIALLWDGFLQRSESPSPSRRSLQTQTSNFRANYTAEFQHLSDPGCSDDSPLLYINCYGQSMTILSTSDSSIACQQMVDPIVPYGASYECYITCSGTDCQSVYLLKNSAVRPIDGPFGSISFLCEGDTLQDVDASFTYVGEANGTCALSPSVDTTGRNIHFGLLGISCPDVDGTSRGYIYDDTFFECRSEGSFAIDLTDSVNDVYACSAGFDCDAGAECSFPISDITVETNVRSFSVCVESLDSWAPTVSPTLAPPSALEYSAQFEAAWALRFDSEGSRSSCFGGENPLVLVACENGATIEYSSSTDTFMDCTKTSDSELACMASDVGLLVDQFVSVFYDCVGPHHPSSRVTYPETTSFCENNTAKAIIQHSVNLGVACQGDSSVFFYYDDPIMECADISHGFARDPFNSESANSVRCSERATFAAGSSSSNIQTIRSVTIVTDDFWLNDGFRENCLALASASVSASPRPSTYTPTIMLPATNHPVTLSPTPPRNGNPTIAPTTSKQTSNPTQRPTNAPTSLPSPTPSIVTVLSRAPTLLPFSASPSQSREPTSVPTVTIPPVDIGKTSKRQEGGETAVITMISGVVAGVVVLATMAFFVRRQYRRRTTASPKGGGDASPDPMPHTDSNTSGADENPLDLPPPIASNSLIYVATPVADPGDNLAYKDQCRSVDGPVPRLGIEEEVAIPFAHAVQVSETKAAIS